jgi:hypothetical protein
VGEPQPLLKQQHNAAFILPPTSLLAQDISIMLLSFSITELKVKVDGC